jgi:hypothetical protein
MKSLISAGRGCLSAAVAMFVLAGGAHASLIGIHNTGVTAGGVAQPDGSAELFYHFFSVPAGCSGICANTQVRQGLGGGFPIPPWLPDSTISAWIGPLTTDAVGPAGDYIYRITFDLSGLIPGTALLGGRWSTDNGGTNILLNGVSEVPPNAASPDFTAWTPFSINSGFRPNVNTLDFVVNNQGGPTGLRVEFTTATADPISQQGVPEPASLFLLGAGLVAFGMFRRRLA